jgi:hypothetical protein
MMRLRPKATSSSCRLAGITLVALAAAGCPGNVDPSLWPSSNAGEGGSGGPPPCDPTPVFAAHNCTLAGCHDDLGTSANFEMKSTGWETKLVGVFPKGGGGLPSKCATSSKPFLIPGVIPATGLFIDKVKPSATLECGDPMPLVGATLTDDEFACVQSWANAIVMAGGSGPGGTSGGGGSVGGAAAGSGGASGGTSGASGHGGTSGAGTGGRGGSSGGTSGTGGAGGRGGSSGGAGGRGGSSGGAGGRGGSSGGAGGRGGSSGGTGGRGGSGGRGGGGGQ